MIKYVIKFVRFKKKTGEIGRISKSKRIQLR